MRSTRMSDTVIEARGSRTGNLARRLGAAMAGDHCGCLTGAVFLVAAFVGTTAWFAWHHLDQDLGSIALRVLGGSMVASLAGKLIGLGLYRTRRRRMP